MNDSNSGQVVRPKVLDSLHNERVDKCVDIILKPDGSFVYKEFRKDVEDQGRWQVNGPEMGPFPTQEAATLAALEAVPWLRRD